MRYKCVMDVRHMVETIIDTADDRCIARVEDATKKELDVMVKALNFVADMRASTNLAPLDAEPKIEGAD